MAASEADWERLQAPPLPDGKPAGGRRRHLQRYVWGVVTLLLLLTTGGSWWWRTRPDRQQQAAAEGMAQPTVSGVAQRPDRFVATAPDHPSDPGWWLRHGQEVLDLRTAIQTAEPEAHLDVVLHTVELIPLHTVEFWGEQAVAQVITAGERGAPAYRQTRFYRRLPTGWEQTAPDAALWGPERRLETTFFVFHFRQHDAQAVIAAASQIDALYTTLQRNFGLTIPPGAAKLMIEVSVTQSPGHALFQPHNYEHFVMEDHLIIASPAVYRVPVELTDADLLAQSIALPLLDQVIVQAGERYPIDSVWQPMLRGVRLWQVWDLDLPLAVWQKAVVQWLYLDLPASRSRAAVLPDRYAELCATHKLWLPSPMQINIPLLCAEQDWEEMNFAMWGPRDRLTRLAQLAVPGRPGSYRGSSDRNQVHHPGQTVALATLIEYAVTTYGRERLPVLMVGLGQYDTWETLLPAVYGVSPTEFEAGWQAYLAEHYGVSSFLSGVNPTQ